VEGPEPSWTVFSNVKEARGQKDQNGRGGLKDPLLSIGHNKLLRSVPRHSHEGKGVRPQEE